MSVNIEPIADYVLAQQEEAETKTASGIFLPTSSSQEKPKIAKVLAIGNDVKKVKVGTRIIFKPYSTNDVKVGTEEYILVKEEDVIATVK